jgi:hypothetical protein
VHRPEDVAAALDDVLFSDELQKRAYLSLSEAESLHDAIETADPEVADLLRRLAVEEPVIVDNGLADPVDAVVHQLIRAAAQRALTDLAAEVRASPSEGPDAMTQTASVRRWMEDLDGPAGHDAAIRLVAWLRSRVEEG